MYVAVAEAIYAHTTVKQRLQISDAPVDKAGFIDYLVDVFKKDSSAAYGSEPFETEADEDWTAASNADGIELAERPKSAHRPRPESARGRTQENAEGNANQEKEKSTAYETMKNMAKKVRAYRPFGSKRTADLSTLLRDLKHVSENEAYAPPI